MSRVRRRGWRAAEGRATRAASLALVVAALGLVFWAGVANGEIELLQPMTVSVGAGATPDDLVARAVAVDHACADVTPAVTIYPSDTRALVTITLPEACRGTDFTFRVPVDFTATANMEGEIGVEASTWSAAAGTLAVCERATVGACVSSTLDITSATALPDSTTVGALTTGRLYGPQVETELRAPGGTITLVLNLVLIHEDAATGGVAWVQEDAITFHITQD